MFLHSGDILRPTERSETQQQAEVATGTRREEILENRKRNEVEKGERGVYGKTRHL
jgi:hypothetical protein